jgi:hypothetical protein
MFFGDQEKHSPEFSDFSIVGDLREDKPGNISWPFNRPRISLSG